MNRTHSALANSLLVLRFKLLRLPDERVVISEVWDSPLTGHNKKLWAQELGYIINLRCQNRRFDQGFD